MRHAKRNNKGIIYVQFNRVDGNTNVIEKSANANKSNETFLDYKKQE